MSEYAKKLRQEKKVELSRKVSLSIAEEIWEMSWKVKDAEEFVDYLMTITDQEAIEEFFNQCHDANGRFCGGGAGGGKGKAVEGRGWLRDAFKGEKFVPGRDDDLKKEYQEVMLFKNPVLNPKSTDKVLDIERRVRERNYNDSLYGQAKAPGKHLITRKPGVGLILNRSERKQLMSDIRTHRKGSSDFKEVVGPLGHVRSTKLSKKNLNSLTTDQLKVIDNATGAIQHNTDLFRRLSLSPVQRIVMGGISRRAGAQRTRVRAEIKKRGSKPQFDFVSEVEELDADTMVFAEAETEDSIEISELIAFFEEYVNDTDPESELRDDEKANLKAAIEHLKSMQ